MKEPEISVGIVNAQEIHFSLNGNFFAKGETVCGEQQVAFSEGGILWNGNLYRELTFTPQDEHASARNPKFYGNTETSGGRRQNHRYQYSSRRRLSDKRHLLGDERHFLFGVSESPYRGITQLAVCPNRETQGLE